MQHSPVLPCEYCIVSDTSFRLASTVPGGVSWLSGSMCDLQEIAGSSH